MSNDIVFTPATLKTIKRDLLSLLDTIDKAIEAAGATNVSVEFENLTRPERVEYILNGAARFFGTTMEDIKRRVSSGDTPNRKRYISKLLYDYCGLTQAEIMQHVGVQRSTVANGMIRFNEQIGTSPFGDKRMRNIWLSLVEYLKLPPHGDL